MFRLDAHGNYARCHEKARPFRGYDATNSPVMRMTRRKTLMKQGVNDYWNYSNRYCC